MISNSHLMAAQQLPLTEVRETLARTEPLVVSSAADMMPLADLAGPSDAELWAIEMEPELLAAELALVGAESAWYSNPCPDTAADYLEALVEVVDLLDLYGRPQRLVVAA